MFDIDTYLTTQNTSGGPIIRQLDRPVTYDYGADDDDGGEISLGAVIGQALALTLIASVLLYFYLAR